MSMVPLDQRQTINSYITLANVKPCEMMCLILAVGGVLANARPFCSCPVWGPDLGKYGIWNLGRNLSLYIVFLGGDSAHNLGCVDVIWLGSDESTSANVFAPKPIGTN